MHISLINRCIRSGVVLSGKRSNGLFLRSTCVTSRYNFSSSVKGSELTSSTLLVQDGYNVQELPVIVRKIKDVVVLCQNNWVSDDTTMYETEEPSHYPIIQEEFQQCRDLKDVFTLLSKCNKITASIALAAVEQIYALEERNETSQCDGGGKLNPNVNMAKGAIVDKLMNVLLKTEDTQTLLNALWAVSSLVEQHRGKFTDELLLRVTDNKLSIEQLCEFIRFLHANKADPQLEDVIDKLWSGYTERETDITEKNIVAVYTIIPALKSSKMTVMNILEKKLMAVWWKLKAPEILEIMEVLWKEKYASYRTMQVIARWTNTNIHVLNEDVLLDIVTKFTSLKYTDTQFEKAIERYVKVKGIKISSYTLIVSILQYCLEFRIKNFHILNGCAEYFSAKGNSVPPIFLRSFIYPFGFLCFHPANGPAFWRTVEEVFDDKFLKLKPDDVIDIMLSCIYLEKYPLNFVDRVFNRQFLAKVNNCMNAELLKVKLKLIDTAMSLECKSYHGPLLPKDHSYKSVNHDSRTKRLINSIRETLDKVAGGAECYSISLIIPSIYVNELYHIDILLHPAGLGQSILNLKLKSDRNINVAVLIHLPEHYCAGSEQLIGPQTMRTKHLRLLGMKVASLNYKTLASLKMYRVELEKYIIDSLKQAQPCL